MLPDLAFIALDEESVGVRLVIITALVLLETADAARDFVFLVTGVIHRFVFDTVGSRIVRSVEVGILSSLIIGLTISMRILLSAMSCMATARG
jgi:hypothetical protein